jgi:hypothetical protein
VEDRDRLRQRQSQVKNNGLCRGLLDSLGPQFALALGGSVRLGSKQQLVTVGGFPAAIRVPAELGAVGCLALAVQKVVRLTLDPLAGLEAEHLGTWAPPSARRLSPALAGPPSTCFQMYSRS